MREALPLLLAAAAPLPLLPACVDSTLSTSNTPPSVVIEEPVDGSTHSAAFPLVLRGKATDSGAGGGIVEVAWTSDVSGVLVEGEPDEADGTASWSWEEPAAGAHRITLRATDTGGASRSTSVSVTILANVQPDCAITSPTGEKVLDSGSPMLLQGQVSDDNTAVTDLLILWESDVDGVLDESPPDEKGVVSALVQPSPGNHTITLTVTDEAGLYCEDSVFVTTNGAPSAPGISLLPDPPSIEQDLVAVITTPAVDPEGGDVEYSFAWLLDGVPWSPPGEPDTVPASALARDQHWLVQVEATDPLGVHSPVSEAQAIVPDSAPTAPVVEITPGAPTQAQDLLCDVVVPGSDPDPSDVVGYSWEWLRDGGPTSLSGQSLGWEETQAGEQWTCRATPSDGTLSGPPGEATVTIEQGCSSLLCDGASGPAVVPDAAALRLASGSFTVEAWLRPDSLPSTGEAAVAAKRGTGSANGWYLAVSPAGLPLFQVSIGDNPRLFATTAVGLGDWHHVALVYDAGSGQGTFFVDGTPSGSAALPAPNAATTADLHIGDDSAGQPDRTWDGLIDDLRISAVARYGIAFIPDTSLSADADTIAWWGFEEGSGTAVADLSGNGHDGMLAGAAFSSESTCGLDLPPTVPGIAIGPAWPDDDDALSCSLTTPSVDPEGLAVSYQGTWLVDGAPSGNTFVSFPATLPASATSEGETWTCQVVATDGAQPSASASASLDVGMTYVCSLLVADPASAGSFACAFTAPISGLLRFTMDNPDASADGQFVVDMGTRGTSYVFSGMKDWAYGGDTVAPWAEAQMEMNVSPALGPLTLTLLYDPQPGSDNTGPDALYADFVYYDQLDTATATLIASNTVTSAEASDSTPAPTNAVSTIAAGQRLLLEAGPCGSAGLGAHGVYASSDGLPGNDGLVRVDTGEGETCSVPLRSLTIAPGTWSFSVIHEDDFWIDNTGSRGLAVYKYTP